VVQKTALRQGNIFTRLDRTTAITQHVVLFASLGYLAFKVFVEGLYPVEFIHLLTDHPLTIISQLKLKN